MIRSYLWGSRIYGTAIETSDWDWVFIDPAADVIDEITVNDNNGVNNIKIMSDRMFQALLVGHDICAMECYFLNPDDWTWNLHLPTLREQISHKVSHSWVKAKKLLRVENEIWRAQKSLFHSFRICEFGTQIAQEGKIYDYSAANAFLAEVLQLKPDWDIWDSTFRTRNREMMTAFRELAPRTS